jgi:hypothetical protein
LWGSSLDRSGRAGYRKSIRQGGETGVITMLSRDGSPAFLVYAAGPVEILLRGLGSMHVERTRSLLVRDGLASSRASRAEHGVFG